MKRPTVSIIMPSYNHAAFIGAAIESVQQQDYDSWELLIADDASTDRTLDVLASYTDDSRIKIFPFKINREYHMRNFAAKYARGDYISFLNSDDIFLPGKIRKQVEHLERQPQPGVVFTHVKCIDENNRRIPNHHFEKIFAVTNQTRQGWLRQFFLSGNGLCISSAIIRRDFFEEIGTFNPLLIQIGDLDLWIKACLKRDIHVIPEQLTGMRILEEDKNLSTPSPASCSRVFLECQQVYDHYFSADGLAQMPGIFPELAALLPEDTWEWRYYLLCRTATSLPFKAMRLFGFVKLHEMLKCEEAKKFLLRNNPRLLRTMFLSEGGAGLDVGRPGVTWKIYFLDENGAYCSEKSYSCWATAAKKSVACFSFPNPRTSNRLCLSIEGKSIPLIRQRVSLYNQQTGEVIFDSGHPQNAGTVIAKNKLTKGFNLNFYFPKLEFTAISSKWIDIEIQYALAPSYSFSLSVKKKLFGLCSRALSCLSQR